MRVTESLTATIMDLLNVILKVKSSGEEARVFRTQKDEDHCNNKLYSLKEDNEELMVVVRVTL